MMNKQCKKCDQVLPRKSFSRHQSTADGLRSHCVKCRSAELSVYRQAHREEVSAKTKAYELAHREHIAERRRVFRYRNQETLAEKAKQYYQHNKDKILLSDRLKRERYLNDPIMRQKIRAREAVNSAIRYGRITKSPCAVCGEIKVEAHHHLGYDEKNKLHIVWLCSTHHGEQHRIYPLIPVAK